MRHLRQLWFQVLLCAVLGAAFGALWPETGAALNPIALGFVKLVSMLISPIIFCTVVLGIGSMSDLKKIGRVGLVALVYFEAVTTLALVIGLIVVNFIKPGAGIHAHLASLDPGAISGYLATAKKMSVTDYLLNIIPTTLPGALTSGEILQVLLVSVLFAVALVQIGDKGRPVFVVIESAYKVIFGIVGIIVKLAPLAAFAAVAFTVGKYGVRSIGSLLSLMLCVYLTMAVFIVVVLGGILRLNGFRLGSFLRYLREELFLVIGTSSSETALPGLIAKLENLGCAKPVVGLVVPAGYSFNLDGTCIYLTMAAVFIAQATDTPLSLGQQLLMLGVLLLTSKGSAGVTGAGFITLSATLASTQTVPVAGLTLILGIDRFMSQARAITNLIGNAVAVVTISAWEDELDRGRARRVLAGEPPESHPGAAARSRSEGGALRRPG